VTAPLNDLRIAVVSTSPRHGSQSARVAASCSRWLGRRGVAADTLDLALVRLPTAGLNQPPPAQTDWPDVDGTLRACDALVLVVPEWGGMAPPAAKNLLLLCDDRQLAHKPVLLVGVSTGQGGAYPLAELRLAAFKNNFALWLPLQVILRAVDGALATDLEPPDSAQELRLSEGLAMVREYARLLQPARSRLLAVSTFTFGV